VIELVVERDEGVGIGYHGGKGHQLEGINQLEAKSGDVGQAGIPIILYASWRLGLIFALTSS
jgi:hypothetical protein